MQNSRCIKLKANFHAMPYLGPLFSGLKELHGKEKDSTLYRRKKDRSSPAALVHVTEHELKAIA
jgi:hypothetical protein